MQKNAPLEQELPLELFEADASTGPSSDQLADIDQCCKDLEAAYKALAAAELVVEEAEKKARNIEEVILPQKLLSAGVQEFTTVSGVRVSINKVYEANISKTREAEAYQWLADNDQDSIVKTTIELSFGKGESEESEQAEAKLQELGIPYTTKRGVHYQTLKSWVKQMKESEDHALDFPDKLFGVFDRDVAKASSVVVPKRKYKRK